MVSVEVIYSGREKPGVAGNRKPWEAIAGRGSGGGPRQRAESRFGGGSKAGVEMQMN